MQLNRKMLQGLVTRGVIDDDGQLALLIIVANLTDQTRAETVDVSVVAQTRAGEIMRGVCATPEMRDALHQAIMQILMKLVAKNLVRVSSNQAGLTQAGREIIRKEVERQP